jgi:hypothetical protein
MALRLTSINLNNASRGPRRKHVGGRDGGDAGERGIKVINRCRTWYFTLNLKASVAVVSSQLQALKDSLFRREDSGINYQLQFLQQR